jgi:hypothetical protein
VKTKTKNERPPVSFKATKRTAKKVSIDFSGKRDGEVSFKATKRIPKSVKMNFWEEVKHPNPKVKTKFYIRKKTE